MSELTERLEDRMNDILADMQVLEVGSEESKNAMAQFNFCLAALERVDDNTRKNLQTEHDCRTETPKETKESKKSTFYIVKDVNDMVLRWAQTAVSAGSVLIPPAFGMYMSFLAYACDEKGLLVTRDPGMKWGEKMFNQIGRMTKA